MSARILTMAVCLALLPGACVAAEVWQRDDFETPPAPGWPRDWYRAGGASDPATNYLDDTVAYEGRQSLRLFAAPRQWSGASTGMVADPDYYISFAMRNSSEPFSSPGSARGVVAFADSPFAGPGYGRYYETLFSFMSDGTIATPQGDVVGQYQPGEWQLVELFVRQSSLNPDVRYWINGAYAGSRPMGYPAFLTLQTHDGTVWFDDYTLSPLPEPASFVLVLTAIPIVLGARKVGSSSS